MTMQIAVRGSRSDEGAPANRRKRFVVAPMLCLALVGGAAGGIGWSEGGRPSRVEAEAEAWVEAWVLSAATASYRPFPVTIAMVFAR